MTSKLIGHLDPDIESMTLYDSIGQTILSAADGNAQSIFLLGTIYAFLVCFYSVIWQMRMHSWPSVTGRLERLGVKSFDAMERVISNRDYVGDALYTYQVEGREYMGKRISPWVLVASHNMRAVLRRQLKGVRVSPDNNVTVYYNPRNPKKSFLKRIGAVSQLVTALIGIAPLLFYLAKY